MADFIFSKILNKKKTNGEGMICVGLKSGDVMWTGRSGMGWQMRDESYSVDCGEESESWMWLLCFAVSETMIIPYPFTASPDVVVAPFDNCHGWSCFFSFLFFFQEMENYTVLVWTKERLYQELSSSFQILKGIN